MSLHEPVVSLRARTRDAVRQAVIDSALRLFADRGYDAVTMESIAASVGMSRRTLHRYFSSKDEIVLGKFERLGDEFVESLRSRPLEESAWESLRVVFLRRGTPRDEDAARRDREVTRIIEASSALYAGYLQRTQGAQALLADVLRERAGRKGTTVDPTDPSFDAVVAAACACRTVALSVSASTGTDFEQALDRAMGALRPTA